MEESLDADESVYYGESNTRQVEALSQVIDGDLRIDSTQEREYGELLSYMTTANIAALAGCDAEDYAATVGTVGCLLEKLEKNLPVATESRDGFNLFRTFLLKHEAEFSMVPDAFLRLLVTMRAQCDQDWEHVVFHLRRLMKEIKRDTGAWVSIRVVGHVDARAECGLMGCYRKSTEVKRLVRLMNPGVIYDAQEVPNTMKIFEYYLRCSVEQRIAWTEAAIAKNELECPSSSLKCVSAELCNAIGKQLEQLGFLPLPIVVVCHILDCRHVIVARVCRKMSVAVSGLSNDQGPMGAPPRLNSPEYERWEEAVVQVHSELYLELYKLFTQHLYYDERLYRAMIHQFCFKPSSLEITKFRGSYPGDLVDYEGEQLSEEARGLLKGPDGYAAHLTKLRAEIRAQVTRPQSTPVREEAVGMETGGGGSVGRSGKGGKSRGLSKSGGSGGGGRKRKVSSDDSGDSEEDRQPKRSRGNRDGLERSGKSTKSLGTGLVGNLRRSFRNTIRLPKLPGKTVSKKQVTAERRDVGAPEESEPEVGMSKSDAKLMKAKEAAKKRTAKKFYGKKNRS